MGSIPLAPLLQRSGGAAGGCPAGLISTCTHRSDFDCRMLPSKSPLALLELAYGAQKIDLAEGRPKNVSEIKLAVGALPQQKSRKTDFAASPDDQIGVRQVWCVEIAADRIRCH